MKKIILLLLSGIACCGVFAQETMKIKLKPLIENYLKHEPEYINCVIGNVSITNISILDEKEKNKSLYDFYHASRLKQMEELAFIKGKLEYIDQHSDDKAVFKRYIAQIDTALGETVPVVDSLWQIEERYKNMVVTSATTEYYMVTFDFSYTLNNSKVNEKAHRMLFTSGLQVIHHDFLNR